MPSDQIRVSYWLNAVVESLEKGECSGILPAAHGFLDGFADFLLEAGILDAFAQFLDPRQRRSIPIESPTGYSPLQWITITHILGGTCQ
jgi:hypothetical protein